MPSKWYHLCSRYYLKLTFTLIFWCKENRETVHSTILPLYEHFTNRLHLYDKCPLIVCNVAKKCKTQNLYNSCFRPIFQIISWRDLMTSSPSLALACPFPRCRFLREKLNTRVPVHAHPCDILIQFLLNFYTEKNLKRQSLNTENTVRMVKFYFSYGFALMKWSHVANHWFWAACNHATGNPLRSLTLLADFFLDYM